MKSKLVSVFAFQSRPYFSSLLQGSNSALEVVDLSGNIINDRTMIALSEAVTDNDALREMWISEYHISVVGWTALAQSLCDKSSIMATYNSNHKLQEVSRSKESEGLQLLRSSN